MTILTYGIGECDINSTLQEDLCSIVIKKSPGGAETRIERPRANQLQGAGIAREEGSCGLNTSGSSKTMPTNGHLSGYRTCDHCCRCQRQ
jgi:hypothetical protein